jgi:hypothetical protein
VKLFLGRGKKLAHGIYGGKRLIGEAGIIEPCNHDGARYSSGLRRTSGVAFMLCFTTVNGGDAWTRFPVAKRSINEALIVRHTGCG